MKLKKVLALFLVTVLIIGTLAGCAQNTGGESAPEKQFVTIVTGSTGGTYYPVGTILATLWSEKLGDQGVVASAQSSGGSVENLNMVNAGEAQLGIAMSNLTYAAYKGEGQFADNKFEKVRFVTGLWPELTQFVVTEASGINSVADIKGKRFNVGGAGSGTEHSSTLIIENIGKLSPGEYSAEHLGYMEASSAMQNGQLDGMNAEAGLPTSAVSEIFASKTPVKFLEFSKEEHEVIKALAPEYGYFTIPAGTYTNQDEDVNTIGIKCALFASEDLDEELVYNLVKTMYENYEEIVGSHKALESVTLDQATYGLTPVPFHQGAVRFYKEKGIEVPEAK